MKNPKPVKDIEEMLENLGKAHEQDVAALQELQARIIRREGEAAALRWTLEEIKPADKQEPPAEAKKRKTKTLF